MIAKLCVVARERKHVVDTEERGAQQVRLQSDTVSVPAGQLEDRIESRILQRLADSQRADAHDGGLAVGDIDRVNSAKILLCAFYHFLDMESLWRTDLGRYYKFALFKQLCNFHNDLS